MKKLLYLLLISIPIFSMQQPTKNDKKPTYHSIDTPIYGSIAVISLLSPCPPLTFLAGAITVKIINEATKASLNNMNNDNK